MENVPTWVTILITILGTLGGGFGVWLLNLYQARAKSKLDASKQTNDHDLAKNKLGSEIKMTESEQAFKMYKDLLDGLRNDVNKMTEDMNKLEKDYLISREENASLKAELKAALKEIDYLRGKSSPTP